jgi:hypothetical protein
MLYLCDIFNLVTKERSVPRVGHATRNAMWWGNIWHGCPAAAGEAYSHIVYNINFCSHVCIINIALQF